MHRPLGCRAICPPEANEPPLTPQCLPLDPFGIPAARALIMRSNLHREWVSIFVVLAILMSADSRLAADPPDPKAETFFETKVRPVLAENCFKCHGDTKQKGGLRLD